MVMAAWQKRIYEESSRILLAEVPEQDANERISLLTVIAGVRPVALFLDMDEPNKSALARLLGKSQLFAVDAPGPTMAYTWESPYPNEITDLFRRDESSPALWVCSRRDDVRAVRMGLDQIAAGRLLCYPECCVAVNQQENAGFDIAVIGAYLRAFDGDPSRIAQALRDDRNVIVDWNDDNRVPRTMARYPFVQHIACESCLVTDASPTAALNSRYQEIAVVTDPQLHDYIVRLAKRSD
jgi:hypothetical protein